MKTTATTLDLLTDEGPVSVTFKPELTLLQYAQLLEAVRKHDGPRKDLTGMVEQLAAMWHSAVLWTSKPE